MVANYRKIWIGAFSTNGVILLSGLISGVLVARILEPEGRGALAAILLWPHVITGVTSLGLNESITIESASIAKNCLAQIRSTVLWLSIALACIVVLIFYPVVPLLMSSDLMSLQSFSQTYLIFFVPASFIAMNLLAVDLGVMNFKHYNILRVIQSIIFPLALMGFWIFDQVTVVHAAYAVIMGAIFTAAIRIVFVRKALSQRPDILLTKSLLANGLHIHVINLLMIAIADCDKMFLTFKGSAYELGLYTVALTVAATGQGVITKSFTDIILPKNAQNFSLYQLSNEMVNLLQRAFILIALGNLALLITSPILIPLLFGKAFEGAVPIAQILLIAFIFQGIKKTIIYFLRAQKQNEIGRTAEFITLIVILASIMPFHILLGTAGVAYAILLGHILGCIYLILDIKNRFNLKIKNWLYFKTIFNNINVYSKQIDMLLDVIKMKKKLLYISIILLLTCPVSINLGAVPIALAFCLLAILPILHSIIVRKNIFEPIALISLIYLTSIPTFFLFSEYFNGNFFKNIDSKWLMEGLFWGYIGFSSFLVGYYIIDLNKSSKYQFEYAPKRQNFYFYCASVIGVIAIIGKSLLIIKDGGISSTYIESEHTGEISSYGQALTHFAALRFSYILIYIVLRRNNFRKLSMDIMFYIMMFLQLMEIVGAGSKSSALSLIITFCVSLSLTKQKVTSKQFLYVLPLLVVILFTFRVVSTYRELTLERFQVNPEFSQQFILFTEAMGNSLFLNNTKPPDNADTSTAETMLGRLTLIGAFGNLLQFSNGASPYEHSIESFFIPLYAITPRNFFEKPQFFGSAQFASRFFNWKFGGISVTLLGSFYWAWGYIGILLGMFFVGGLLGYINKKANSSHKFTVIYQALLVILILLLMDVGKTFQDISFELIRQILILTFISKSYPIFRYFQHG